MNNLKREKINITPDTSLYPKLGQAGYSISEAIAEFVDNSIDARRENYPVLISIEFNGMNNQIVIEDDGNGMDKDQASKSIVLAASKKKENELGQFGLGLKTAAMTLGKKFSIETKQKNSKEEYKIVFDKEEFNKNGSWEEFYIYINKGVKKEKSGTKVTIDKLNISISGNIIYSIKHQLQERFSPFILNKEAIIKIDNQVLKPEIIKIIPKYKKKFEIKLSNGKTIKGWTGILEIGSQSKSGFNLYKKNRLIRVHEKLGYAYHPSKMWVTGEAHLDFLPVTHNKREFITIDPLYIEFLEEFQKIIKPVLAAAQKRHREQNIKNLTEEVRETLKDDILKAIDKVDDFKEMAYPDSDLPQKRTEKGGDFFEKEKREEIERKSIIEIKETKSKKIKKRTPKKTQIKKVRFITIAGKKYKFDYDWQSLEDPIPKTSFLDKDKNLIMIILNSEYPLLNITKDKVLYVSLFVTEGIIEEVLKENKQSLDRVIEIRDKTIKKLAEIITEDIEDKKNTRENQEAEAIKAILKNKSNLSKFPKRELKVLKYCLGTDGKQVSLDEIGKKLGITRERVRQLRNKGLEKINKYNLEQQVKPKPSVFKYNIPIENLDISARTYNTLARNNIKNVGDILEMNKPDLMKLRGLGRSSYKELNNKINELGLDQLNQ